MDEALGSLAEQQQWSAAPDLLGATLSALPSAFLESSGIDVSDTKALAARASDPDNPGWEPEYRTLIRTVARIPEEELLAMGRKWLETRCVYLHLAIPAILREYEEPSEECARQVLAWGVGYPDPNLNRDFIEAATERLGREAAVAFLLDGLRDVAAAYYWLAGGEPVCESEQRLRRQLEPVAEYLKPIRWWQRLR